MKLNLISEEGFFLLSQNREVRNNFSVAHPSVVTIDEDEFLSFLNRCARHALSDENNPRGVDLQALLTSLKASTFNPQQLDEWATRLRDTFEAQRELLIGTLHGIYCDPTSSEEARQNALSLSQKLSPQFTPRITTLLVDRHQDYTARGDIDRQKASRQFFERIQILNLLGEAELHHIISSACDNLVTVHNSMNNFYNEPPFAARLLEVTSQGRVPESVRDKFVNSVVLCAIGNRYGVSEQARDFYNKLVQAFSPAEIGIMLNLPALPTMVAYNVANYHSCRKEYQKLVRLLNPASIPTVAQPTYQAVLATQL